MKQEIAKPIAVAIVERSITIERATKKRSHEPIKKQYKEQREIIKRDNFHCCKVKRAIIGKQ